VLPERSSNAILEHMNESACIAAVPEAQRLQVMMLYGQWKKDRVVGLLPTFVLGAFGAHRFYLGDTGKGILYILFVWTLIPAIIAFVELFLIMGRVDRCNEAKIAEAIFAVTGGRPQKTMVYA
jgi:TM2 domain-containing membrane protein YozV